MCPHHPSLPRPSSGSTRGKWTMMRRDICLFLFFESFLNLCLQDQCPEVILTTDVPFRRLDHYKIHEYTKKWNMNARREPEPVMMTMTTNIDTMFKRKRGRPPKNRVIEVSLLHSIAAGGGFMEPNEKLLSFSRFQIGLSKADLQPSSGVCMTRTRLENSRTVVGQIGLLLQPTVQYGPAGCIIWKLPLPPSPQNQAATLCQ